MDDVNNILEENFHEKMMEASSYWHGLPNMFLWITWMFNVKNQL